MSAMTFTARDIKDVDTAGTQCAIVPLFEGAKLAGAALKLDKASSGAIKSALALGDFSAKSGESLMLPGVGAIKRILLVGCGESKSFDRAAARKFCHQVYRALESKQATTAMLHLAALELKEKEAIWTLTYLARHLVACAYRYTETLSKPKEPWKLTRLVVNTSGALPSGAAGNALRQGRSIGIGVNEARNLANLPGNICTPSYLSNRARKLARNNAKLSVTVVEEKKMRELGMGALLSVSAGSDQPAKLIVMHYKGGKAADKPYVLVGKGITFDSGGISLKPGAKMDEMKFDMGGAASVFGTMRAVVDLGLGINVVGIVAAAENMPSGGATKPGDVVTSMSGKTIEVLNTDAEGRLVLCDALTYAARFKPATVIDIATLTGACVVALGSQATGLFANEDKLAEQLLAAGTDTHDRAWRMPMWEEYQSQLKSNFADIANIGGPGGGSITAACFLSRFTKDYSWAHLDIAGSAWDSAPKGATGRPVALLTRYLLDRAGQ
ncbi:MAG: leucyl aminopeptidase [Halioglobus sp.]|nr:leucyl aminopeptidase [Halioglobus sp.]